MKFNRNESIRKMRYSGITLQDIGNAYGLTRERIRQIVGNTGRLSYEKAIQNASVLADKYFLEGFTTPEVENITRGVRGRNTILNLFHQTPHNINGINNKFGWEWENKVSSVLTSIGIENKRMPFYSPFDILAFDRIRIDVKSRRSPNKDNMYSFKVNKDKKGDYVDFFICCLSYREEDIYFVIPSQEVRNTYSLYISYPIPKRRRSPYHQYLNRFDLLI